MNIPILGQGAQQPDRIEREYGTVHDRAGVAQAEILDSEVDQIGVLSKALELRYKHKSFDVEEFEREAKDRFHKIGFAIEILWKKLEVNGRIVEGAASPEITIVGRVDRGQWDPDRQVHEVTNNILELPGQDAGVVKSTPGPEVDHKH